MHAITFLEDICINIQKIISIGHEIKKILITISQTQPIVEGAPQVSLKICILYIFVIMAKKWQVGKSNEKLAVEGTIMHLHAKFHVNRCFRLAVVIGPNFSLNPPPPHPPHLI